MVFKLNKHKALILLILYIIAALFIISLSRSPGFIDERSGMINVVDFNGHKPFQYRVLIPLVIRVTEALTPESVKNNFNKIFGEIINGKIRGKQVEFSDSKCDRLIKYGYRCSIYYILNIVVLFLFFIVLRQLALSFGVFSKRLCDFIPLIIVLPLLMFLSQYKYYFYDYPHLLFFTSGLLFLYKQQWKYYFIVFTLAVLNKETAVMLTVIFFLNYYSQMHRQKFIQLLSIQLLLFAVIKISLLFVFQNNNGVVVEWHLARNISFLLEFGNYFRFIPLGTGTLFPVYLNIPIPVGINLPVFLFTGWAVYYGWSEKPLFLRKALGYLIPMFIMAMTMGFINELRAYYDILPIVYFLGILGIIKFVGKLKLKFME